MTTKSIEALYDAYDDGSYQEWQESILEEKELEEQFLESFDKLGPRAIAAILVHARPVDANSLADVLSFELFDNGALFNE
jgi:hypothetical protein